MSTNLKQKYSRYKQYSTNLAKYYRLPSIQRSLSLVLSVAISALFISVAIRPALIAISELNNTIAESKTILQQLKIKTQALEQASILWEKIQPMQAEIEASFPSNGPNYQTIAEAIEVLARESGATVMSESVGEALVYSRIIDPYEGKERIVVEMPYSVRIKGSYQQTTHFLQQILFMSRVFSLESLSFEKDVSKDNLGAIVSLSLSGQFHYLANEKQLNNILNKR